MRKANTSSSFGPPGLRSPYVVFDGSICVASTALTSYAAISTTALSAAVARGEVRADTNIQELARMIEVT